MYYWMVLALAWLLLPLPFAIVIGRCISLGQLRDAIRQAAERRSPAGGNCLSHKAAPAVEEQPTMPTQGPPHLPAQRAPVVPAPRHVHASKSTSAS